MTVDNSQAKELMQYSFLVVFANDGTIDAQELEFLKKLALRDGSVDDRERLMLSKIFARAAGSGLAPEVRAEIDRFKLKYAIS